MDTQDSQSKDKTVYRLTNLGIFVVGVLAGAWIIGGNFPIWRRVVAGIALTIFWGVAIAMNSEDE